MDPWIEVQEGDMQRLAENAYLFRRVLTKDWAYLCTHQGFVGAFAPEVPMECWATSTDRVDWYCPSMLVEEFNALEQDAVGSNAPNNTSAPQIVQTEDGLHCTAGDWGGDPTGYTYEWNVGGEDTGEGATYTPNARDVGQTAYCVVTAENANGTTTAQSNTLVIEDMTV